MDTVDLGPCLGVDDCCALLHVLDGKPSGCALEFGVADGTSLRVIAEVMPAIGFDCWTGLPADWRPGYPKGTFACDPPEIANTRLVRGLFADTLPGFDFDSVGPIGLVHIDADLYESSATALKYVGPHLKPGCFIVFDEYHGWPGWESGGECRAWREYVADSGVGFDVIGYGPQQFAVRIDG